MNKKHPSESKSMVNPPKNGSHSLKESDRKKLELGEAMEHEHGKNRERIERDIEKLDGGG